MSDTDNVNVENEETEENILGFCSKFQPQLVPYPCGPGKKLVKYKPHYFPCVGDKCADSWCHDDQMCRHRCEHELGYHEGVEDTEDGENIVDKNQMEGGT